MRTLPSGRRPDLSGANRYDGASRDWLIANGKHVGVHPVDQKVAMSFAMKKGDCKPAPLIGNELHTIQHLSADDLQSQVQLHVENAYPFSLLLADGSVTIQSIEHEVKRESQGLAVVVNYRNEVLGADDKARWNQ